jgi:hypothetical protein
MDIDIEHKTIQDFGLTYGMEEDLTPDLMVAVWNFCNHRHLEATIHRYHTGDRIWAKTINKGICEELGIEEFELEQFRFAGMMIEEERQSKNMTEEERELKEHVEAMVDEFLEEFDFDTFYAEKAAAEAEEAMLEDMLKEEDK